MSFVFKGLPMKIQLINLYSKIKTSVMNLNLFDNHSNDLFEIKRERATTRLFLLLFVIIIGILVIYTLISVQPITNSKQFPSRQEYEYLQEQYPTTLQCPCNTVSIPFKEFIVLTPIYHQLCQSDFVQPEFYNSLFILNAEFFPDRFSFVAGPYFRTLAMFCEIANLTVIDANHRFSSTIFVNAEIMPYNIFTLKVKDIIDTFIDLTRAKFSTSLSLINEIIHANQYISGLLTNGIPKLVNISSNDTYKIVWYNQVGLNKNNQTCFCDRDPGCNSGLLSDNNLLPISAVYIHCYMLDTVLQSSLECWYYNSCLANFMNSYDDDDTHISKNVTILDLNFSSRFPPHTLVETIVNEIMIEKWNKSISYDYYYQYCKPLYCSFAYQQRSLTYMITIITSLIGSFSIVLRLICPVIVRIFFRRNNIFVLGRRNFSI